MVKRLLGVFRHIEPVSVVLRFVAPGHNGILSPPVEAEAAYYRQTEHTAMAA